MVAISELRLNRRERLRRVALICASFARNLAFYRAGQGAAGLFEPSRPHASFWRQANGNFLDACVLDWCKLLGDRKAEQGWRKVVADPAAFEADLLARLEATAPEFGSLVDAMRLYRDKSVAHLDCAPMMVVPKLSMARAAVWFYHERISLLEAGPGDLAGLPDAPDKLGLGYAQCLEEAEQVYARGAGRLA